MKINISQPFYTPLLYNTTTKTFDSNYAVLVYYNNTTAGVADNTSASLVAYDASIKLSSLLF